MKWFKCDPDAWLVGVIGLTLEERGVYATFLHVLYSRDGDAPTSDAYWARACECRPQAWRRVRDALIEKGKLHRKTDGKLTANRVENELQSARKRIAQQSGLRQNQLQNQAPADPSTDGQPQPQPQPQPQRKKEDAPSGASSAVKVYVFEDGIIRLTEKDFELWKRSFSAIDVPAELLGLSHWAKEKFGPSKWFQPVKNALAARNRKVLAEREAASRAPVFRTLSGMDGII